MLLQGNEALKRRLAVLLLGPILVISGGVPSIGNHPPATISFLPTPCAGQTIPAGATAIYSVTIENNGEAAQSDPISITLADSDPADFTSGIFDSGGSPVTQVSVPGHSSETLELRVTASATAPYLSSNDTTISATRSDDPSVTGSYVCETSLAQGPGATVSKVVDDASPQVGQMIEYSISYSHPGPQTVTSFAITDTLDPALSFVDAGSSGSFDSGSRTITWTIGDITGPVSGTVTFTATVGQVAHGTVIGNTALADGTNIDAATATQDVAVSAPQVQISKTVSATTARPGDRLSYTISFRNTGGMDLINASISDPVDPNLVVDTSSISGSGSSSGGTITWTLGTLPQGGATQTVTFDATVSVVPDGTTILNSATIDGDAMAPVSSPQVMTTINSEADLTIAKTDSPDPVDAGDVLVYEITVSNLGPNDNSGFTVVDTLPSGLSAIVAPGCSVAGSMVTCVGAGLANGGSEVFAITATVASSVASGSVLSSTASVSSNGTADPFPTNNSASTLTLVTTEADLSVTKVDSPDPVVAGESLSYTVSVTNQGPSDNSGFVLQDQIPPQTSFVSASAGCAESAGLVTCSTAGLAAGSSVSYVIVVQVDPSTPDGSIISNTAALVSTATADPDANDDSATSQTAVRAEADLSVSKSDSPDPVIAAQDVTYTIVVSNSGPSASAGFTLEDQLDGDSTFVAASGGCSHSSGTVTCTSAGMAAGSTVTWTIVAKVNPGTADGETLVNRAEISSSSTSDPVGNNDSASAATRVLAPELDIDKFASPASGSVVSPGQLVNFTMVVANTGGAPATGVVVTDTVDALFGEVTPAQSGVFDPATRVITWQLPTLAVGATHTVGFSARAGSAPSATSIRNRASVVSTELGERVLSNQTTHDLRLPDVVINKIADVAEGTEVAALRQITYALVVENRNSSGSALNAVVTDVLPPHLVYVPGSTTLDGAPVADQGGTSALFGPGITLGTLSPSTFRTIVFKATVDIAAPAGALIENWGYVDWATNGSAVGDFHRLRVLRPLLGPSIRQSILVQGPSGSVLFVTVFNSLLSRAIGVLPVTGGEALVASIFALSIVGAGAASASRLRKLKRKELR